MRTIELIEQDANGKAIEGPKYPRDRGVVVWLDPEDRQRLAYPHKFFKRDKHGRPLEETLVEFLVPDYLCSGASPGPKALQLVAERMGWELDS